MKIETKLVECFFQKYVEENDCLVSELESSSLLTVDRYDLAFKLLYIDYMKNNYSYYKEVYKEHLNIITLGKFIEQGSPQKVGYDAFEAAFNDTYASIMNGGFDKSISLVPLAKDNSIANGAHRVASAIDQNKLISVIQTDAEPQKLNYIFFQDRGASTALLNAGAIKFIENIKHPHVAILWPIANISLIKEVTDELPNVLTVRELRLSINGLKNLISQVYLGESWVGELSSCFNNSMGKVIPCFKEGESTKVVFFDNAQHLDLLLIKEKIRDKFGIGKHSIHITDNKKEAIDIARVILNENAEFVLNNINPYNPKRLDSQVQIFKKNMQGSRYDINTYCISGSMILNLFGLRDSFDIDYCCIEQDGVMRHADTIDQISCHNSEINKYLPTYFISDLILNTHYHFWFQGVKFFSIDVLYQLKNRRNEPKDQCDLYLMSSIADNNSNKLILTRLRSKFYFIKHKLFYAIIDLMVKTSTYVVFRYLYRKLKSIRENFINKVSPL